jgi:hypothetical protein
VFIFHLGSNLSIVNMTQAQDAGPTSSRIGGGGQREAQNKGKQRCPTQTRDIEGRIKIKNLMKLWVNRFFQL